jgi:plasmid replication initiation protein
MEAKAKDNKPLPAELDDMNFSVKSDALANAALGAKISPNIKRCFEGLLSKISCLDLDEFIAKDKPLKVLLSQSEYRRIFPKAKNVSDTFRKAKSYYVKKCQVEIWNENSEEPDIINVVDTARILKDGSLEMLFTRGIMPHLKEVQGRFLILNISEFSKLSSKYSQKLYELSSAWAGNGCLYTRVEIDVLKKIMSVPSSYNTFRFHKQIITPSAEEISGKTPHKISFTLEKGATGKSYKYIDFKIEVEKTKSEEDKGAEEAQTEVVTINNWKEKGVTDLQYQTIVELRVQKNKPVFQGSMDEFFKVLEEISKQETTLDFKECVSYVVNHGYVGKLYSTWFLCEKKVSKSKSITQKLKKEPKEVKKIEEQRSLPLGYKTPKDYLGAVISKVKG